MHYLQSVLTVLEAGVNGFLHVANCFNVQPCYQTRTKFILYVFLLYLIVICRTVVKKNCGKVKKNSSVSPCFCGEFNSAISCCSSLQPRKPSISLSCYKERMCPRTRHNSKRKSKNLATGLVDLFFQETIHRGKDPKKIHPSLKILQIFLHLKSLRTGCVPLLHSFLAWISVWFERWSRL